MSNDVTCVFCCAECIFVFYQQAIKQACRIDCCISRQLLAQGPQGVCMCVCVCLSLSLFLSLSLSLSISLDLSRSLSTSLDLSLCCCTLTRAAPTRSKAISRTHHHASTMRLLSSKHTPCPSPHHRHALLLIINLGFCHRLGLAWLHTHPMVPRSMA